jgi:hypothetical protein
MRITKEQSGCQKEPIPEERICDKHQNMKGFANDTYLLMYVISNAAAILFLLAAWKRPVIARFLFFILFAWAAWTNYTTIRSTPGVYQEYGDLTFLDAYEEFIHGWFRQHAVAAVQFIALSQALIAIAMLFNGWIFRWGCMGGILFLLAIAHFGVGSAFPCTLVLAAALYLLYVKREKIRLAWK